MLRRKKKTLSKNMSCRLWWRMETDIRIFIASLGKHLSCSSPGQPSYRHMYAWQASRSMDWPKVLEYCITRINDIGAGMAHSDLVCWVMTQEIDGRSNVKQWLAGMSEMKINSQAFNERCNQHLSNNTAKINI